MTPDSESALAADPAAGSAGEPAPGGGRPIRLEPLRPGLWPVLLGALLMVMGPLFGFLTGSVLGPDEELLGMSPLFLFLFVGFIVAGVGLGIALLGARRMLRDRGWGDRTRT